MQPHRFFVSIALIFGIFYALVVPPFQSPDEFNHFYRSWQIADGSLVGKKTTDNRLGDSLPSSLLNISKPFSQLPFRFEEHIKSSTIFSTMSIPLNESERSFIDFTNTAVYAPTAYLSQSTTILLFKNLEFTPLSIFYLARLFTLIFWTSIVYKSIKTIPIQKWLFAFLALLPSSLFINSSLNADVFTNALSFLSISLFVKMFFEKNKILKTDILLFFISTTFISLNKFAYLPIVFIFFLIPKESFETPKQKAFFGSLILLTNVLVIVWWSKTIAPLYIRFEDYNPVFRIGQQLNEGVDPMAQLDFVLHNPWFYTKTMMTSFAQTMPHTLIHYVGKFGWEKNYLPLWLILPLFLMIILMEHPDKVGRGGLNSDLRFRISASVKLKIFLIGCLMSASLATAMYLLWCRVGSGFIENLSGKYFIPIFPLFFLALPALNLKKIRFFTTENGIAAWLLLTLIYGIFQVLMRYYVQS
jgi:uncharacterized membrane protein